MKYIVVLGDGMADYPVAQLNNKTPLMVANKPNMDALAKISEVGLLKPTPDSMAPASDTANMAVMGYDPEVYYSGRSSLEAVSMGIDLKDTDITFRCNLVTLSEEADYMDKTMIDHSADEITTAEADVLIKYLGESFNREGFCLYAGFSYRHCLVWDKGPTGLDLTPPHDILERKIGDYLPKGKGSEMLLDMMLRSRELLSDHPINRQRIKKGLRPANSAWFWGEAVKPKLKSMYALYGIRGAVISAVDLIKGLGLCAGLKVIDVEGATGNIHTNYDGKAQAVLDALKSGLDFAYVHIEAPDECGHRHEIENKVKSIELIDKKILGPILRGLNEMNEDYCIAVLPDHPTPLSLRTHTRDAVPYILYRSNQTVASGIESYDEEQAKKTGIFIEKGYTMLSRMFGK
jgi:2,3-bisphosphoglycerate-independent phosphoglycerate mutase